MGILVSDLHVKKLKGYLKQRPDLYDCLIRWRRKFGLAKKDPCWEYFKKFSDARQGNVNFVQIGANDGLGNDPVREFVVNFNWHGLMVEPLPEVYKQLKFNYSRYEKRLTFVNAAISNLDCPFLYLWTFTDKFLLDLDYETRMDYLRKASLDKDQLFKFVDNSIVNCDEIVEKIQVPGKRMSVVLSQAVRTRKLDLIIIDAEGHEKEIICDIDFDIFNPDAIFFESHLLSKSSLNSIVSYLLYYGYYCNTIGGDTVASKEQFITGKEESYA